MLEDQRKEIEELKGKKGGVSFIEICEILIEISIEKMVKLVAKNKEGMKKFNEEVDMKSQASDKKQEEDVNNFQFRIGCGCCVGSMVENQVKQRWRNFVC